MTGIPRQRGARTPGERRVELLDQARKLEQYATQQFEAASMAKAEWDLNKQIWIDMGHQGVTWGQQQIARDLEASQLWNMRRARTAAELCRAKLALREALKDA